jgi:mRNA interferase RelE/StbE
VNYVLIFDEKVIEKLEKFPKNIKKRILNKLEATKVNPYHFFEKLEGRPEYKLRVGDYRVIAEISNKNIQIFVLYVGHRKNIYKKI